MLQGCVNWLTLFSGSCGKSLLRLLTLCGTFNWPLYSNTVIGTLAVDGWAVTFWYSNKGPGRAAAPFSPFLAVPNVTSHPSTANVAYQLHIIWCGTIIACGLYRVKNPWLIDGLIGCGGQDAHCDALVCTTSADSTSSTVAWSRKYGQFGRCAQFVVDTAAANLCLRIRQLFTRRASCRRA